MKVNDDRTTTSSKKRTKRILTYVNPKGSVGPHLHSNGQTSVPRRPSAVIRTVSRCQRNLDKCCRVQRVRAQERRRVEVEEVVVGDEEIVWSLLGKPTSLKSGSLFHHSHFDQPDAVPVISQARQ